MNYTTGQPKVNLLLVKHVRSEPLIELILEVVGIDLWYAKWPKWHLYK